MTIKVKDQEVILEKVSAEKTKLEAELKQTTKASQGLQAELATQQQKVREFESRLDKCSSEKQAVGEFEAQLVKKSKEIYDLTVKLGCIETENKELKVLITDKNSILE